MSRVVWKYDVSRFRQNPLELEIPAGATLLTVQIQVQLVGSIGPVLWALVDPEKPPEVRRLVWMLTGGTPREDLGDYLGTVQIPEGIVLHLFEVGP